MVTHESPITRQVRHFDRGFGCLIAIPLDDAVVVAYKRASRRVVSNTRYAQNGRVARLTDFHSREDDVVLLLLAVAADAI